MLIKCFKKSSFRNSPFSSLSPAPAPGDLVLPGGRSHPILGRCFLSCGTLLQQISKSFAERPVWGSCRLGPVPGTLIPVTHDFFPCLLRARLPREPGWERSHVWGVRSHSLLLCLCLFFHCKHQQLPIWSVKGSIHRISFLKSSTQRNLQGCGFPAAEHVCFEEPALLGSWECNLVSVCCGPAARTGLEVLCWTEPYVPWKSARLLQSINVCKLLRSMNW